MRTRSSGTVTFYYPELDRDELIRRLRAGALALREQLPVSRAVLFGSWAAGRATAFSDVDVMIVYADPPRSDAFQLTREALRVRGLEPHIYAASEAAPVQATLDGMAVGGVDLLATSF